MSASTGSDINTAAVSSQTETSDQIMGAVSNSTSAANGTVARRDNKQGNGNGNGNGAITQYQASETIVIIAESEVTVESFLTFVSGLTVVSVQASISGSQVQGVIPQSISGQSYVFITTVAVSAITDEVISFGPLVIEGECCPATNY